MILEHAAFPSSQIKVHEGLSQGTAEWHDLRLGKITASIVKNLLTSTYKVSKDKKIKMLAYALAAERITLRRTSTFESFDMARGKEEEPIARRLYSKDVQEVGFIENGILGFSPDGLMGDDGIIEIKCVQQKFQVKVFAENEIPRQHVLQIQTGLLVSGRQWCDFIQYSNGMPLFVKRMQRDEEIIENIVTASIEFEETINSIIDDYFANSKNNIVAEWIEPPDPNAIPSMDFDDIFGELPESK